MAFIAADDGAPHTRARGGWTHWDGGPSESQARQRNAAARIAVPNNWSEGVAPLWQYLGAAGSTRQALPRATPWARDAATRRTDESVKRRERLVETEGDRLR
jgi:hypothetical protein